MTGAGIYTDSLANLEETCPKAVNYLIFSTGLKGHRATEAVPERGVDRKGNGLGAHHVLVSSLLIVVNPKSSLHIAHHVRPCPRLNMENVIFRICTITGRSFVIKHLDRSSVAVGIKHYIIMI